MGFLEPGAGYFSFHDSVHEVVMKVHYVCSPRASCQAPLIIALHGRDRSAKDVRDAMAVPCVGNDQIVIVPEFDAQQFPGAGSYNFGGAQNACRQLWNFAIIDRIFDFVCAERGSKATRFLLFGISAGAQFVLRYLALMGSDRVEAAVAANAGAYMLPDLRQPYPVGMGGLDLTEEHLRRYLGAPLTVLIGGEDNDPNAHDLPRDADALAQGTHRLERALWHYGHCRELADRLNVPFEWTLEVVQGAGHISQAIFDLASIGLAHRKR